MNSTEKGVTFLRRILTGGEVTFLRESLLSVTPDPEDKDTVEPFTAPTIYANYATSTRGRTLKRVMEPVSVEKPNASSG
jgi:hypothetical protein